MTTNILLAILVTLSFRFIIPSLSLPLKGPSNSCSLEFPWLNNNKKLRQIKNTGFLKNFLLLVVFNLNFSSN